MDTGTGAEISESSHVEKFRDRQDAGHRLGSALRAYAVESPMVLALPRGGVPVGHEVARALGAPLDVWVVRKVGVPWNPELGAGAVAEGGYTYISPEILEASGLTEEELEAVIEEKRGDVAARIRRLRGDRPAPDVRDRTVILVDDGIATGGTVRAALRAIKAARPKKVVLAVPVASADVVEALAKEVDQVVCLLTPPDLYAIGLYYDDFRHILDDEVVELLRRSRGGVRKEAGDAL